MPAPEVSVRRFRVLARLTLLAAVALTTLGIYAGLVLGRWVWGVVAILGGVALLLPVQWVALRANSGSEDVLIFVTKRACSLCEEARALLPTLLADTPFRVEEAPLEEHAWLRRPFKDRVPVLLWQGEVVAQLAWDPEAVRRRLHHLLARRGATDVPGQQNP